MLLVAHTPRLLVARLWGLMANSAASREPGCTSSLETGWQVTLPCAVMRALDHTAPAGGWHQHTAGCNPTYRWPTLTAASASATFCNVVVSLTRPEMLLGSRLVEIEVHEGSKGTGKAR
jgi:hypothetical protein